MQLLGSYHYDLYSLAEEIPSLESYSMSSPPCIPSGQVELVHSPFPPPAMSANPPVAPVMSLEDSPSVFDILNVFRHQWFLNRDHLLANILSMQKDNNGKIFWVDFLPTFHMHLMQQAIALLPPLCHKAKGK